MVCPTNVEIYKIIQTMTIYQFCCCQDIFRAERNVSAKETFRFVREDEMRNDGGNAKSPMKKNSFASLEDGSASVDDNSSMIRTEFGRWME